MNIYSTQLNSLSLHKTSKTCFYLKLTLPQENVLLNLLAQKYGLQ